MDMLGNFRRDDPNSFDAGKELLQLLQDPFSGQLGETSIWASLGTSIGFTAFIALCFSFLRPYNQSVYAPKLKHADEKHAPPPIGKKPWSWFGPLWSTTEVELVDHAGLDAAVFLRFIRMCRNMFLVLSVLGCCILIPTNISNLDISGKNLTWVAQLTPSNVWGDAHWAQVVVAWLFNFTIMGFLWWNYRKILQLRRRYFESEEYQNSLHARTLMLYDIPKERCSDEGIARIIDEVAPSSSFSRTAIARNVKDLPDLVRQHENTVRKLEKVLAKYMKNPAQLPASRPTCKPSKKDPSYATYPSGQKVDAIEYLTQRIKDLELEIKEVRLSVDRRSTMPYGFASYADIGEAHNIAYACRKKHPLGSTITLAPRPNDIIWDNMPLNPSTRSWRRIINNAWIGLLTLVWIAPNAMIAIFLVNLNNLGRVWQSFKVSLEASPTFWGIVQGIASPALTSLVYIVLPIIFRRLSIQAGDQTKTGRERHVLAKLYAFFVFNNLVVFSLFSTIWAFIAGVISETSHGADVWKAILKENIGSAVLVSLCQVSLFWINWLLQRQLGAAIDLAQLWTLIYSFFMRKFSNPTPRELIELTAPPSFDYASYYNYFLFYCTVALAFGGIQPLVLPAAALYFSIDVWLKKYLILYIFVTKTESGGMFWRVLFNRFLFAAILANLVVFLTTWVRGVGTHLQAFAVAPLPFLIIAFKLYCARAFDDKIHFYTSRNVSKNPEAAPGFGKEQRLRSERLASRFGHPALYKSLITPMVHQKAQASLHIVYKGRLTDGREAGAGDMMSVSGYSDTYAMDSMRAGKPGKQANVPGFEFVADSQMDFEYFKNREEFAAEHGQGDLFGRSADIMRPGTPGSTAGGDSDYGSRPGSPALGPLQGGMTGSRRFVSGASEAPSAFQPYRPSGYRSPTGYDSPPQTGFAQQPTVGDRSRSPLYSMNNGSDTALMRNAASMPFATPGSASRDHSLESNRAPLPTPGLHAPGTGALGVGHRGYSGLSQSEALESPEMEPTQYDYFRGGRNRRPGEGWQ